MPKDWNYGTDRLGGASVALGSGWRGFERYGLITATITATMKQKRVRRRRQPVILSQLQHCNHSDAHLLEPMRAQNSV
jgi:hypothetical protein